MSDLDLDELRAELDDFAQPEARGGCSPREERIIAGFEEIQRFVDLRGRAPQHAERRRRQEAEAQARAKHLSALAKRGEGAWREIEDLIAMRNGSAYDKAATLLLDHREIAAQARKLESFTGRIAELRSRHAKKGQFIARLKAAGL